jgi:hypothetical protein
VFYGKSRGRAVNVNVSKAGKTSLLREYFHSFLRADVQIPRDLTRT